MNKLIVRVLIGILAVGILGYGGIIIYLLTQETTLVFYETYKKPISIVPPDSSYLKYQRLDIRSEDGIKLAGWIILSDHDTLKSPWLLFCHGNASDISFKDYISRYKLFTSLGFNVLTFDYRGFGESEGTPSEAGLYKDVTAGYKYLTISKHISPDRIIIYGHSLGTAVAIDLSTREPAAGLVVEAGFQSIPESAHQLYPFLPMRLLVKNKFMSIDKINRVSIPILFIYSSEDERIPISDGMALYEKAMSPKSFLLIKGSHDSAPIDSRESFCNGLSSYLKGTTAKL